MRCDGWGVHWSTEHARHTRRGARRTARPSRIWVRSCVSCVVTRVTRCRARGPWAMGTGVGSGAWCPRCWRRISDSHVPPAPPPAGRRVPALHARRACFVQRVVYGLLLGHRVGVCSPVSTGLSWKRAKISKRKTSTFSRELTRQSPRRSRVASHVRGCNLYNLLRGWLHAWPANDSSLRTSGSQPASPSRSNELTVVSYL